MYHWYNMTKINEMYGFYMDFQYRISEFSPLIILKLILGRMRIRYITKSKSLPAIEFRQYKKMKRLKLG